MTNKKLTIIYLFLFFIPYVVCLMMIGTSYNTLIMHQTSIWRVTIGGVIGALFLMALKTIMSKVIKTVEVDSKNAFWKALIGFFDIESKPVNLYLNFILDFIFSVVSTYAIRYFFSPQLYIGNLLGYLIIILSLSVLIGITAEYDVLTADYKIK
ncbi:hypothetical protein Q2T76_03800 [Lactobacillus sp. YT155]|uniref:hypothetical protein n=1 Tax=Lactobacillus sp. YT155 TaxID=3060955 RepID=UPI00265D808B|nr:hypothetical protein [Lactobacillus sp. YT155]MDO1605178.1 hypothetical protein [Lactobacillus sp. YT155]